METIGERIKKVREAVGLNPRQFAIAAKINTSNYYKVEAGKLGVRTNSLQAIATHFGARLAWLMTGEGEMFVTPEDGAAANPAEPDNKTPDPLTESGDVNSKYVALLERQEQRTMDIVESAARVVADRLAANYATKKEVEKVAANLGEVQRRLGSNTKWMMNLQEAVVDLFVVVGDLDSERVTKFFDTRASGKKTPEDAHKLQKTGKPHKA